MQNISEIEELIKLISKLPGLGPRSAKRIVLKLINNKEELIKICGHYVLSDKKFLSIKPDIDGEIKTRIKNKLRELCQKI